MGVIIPVGFGQVTVKMRQTGMTRSAMFTWGCEPPDAISLDVQAAGISSILRASGRLLEVTNYVGGWALEQVHLTFMSPVGPMSGQDDTVHVGGKAGEAAPPQVALLVKKNSVLGGRHGRGRLYLPPCFLAETDITQQGTITSGTYGPLKSKIDSTLSALNASDWPVRLLHSTATPGPSPVTQWVLQNVVATQRRRIRR